jgi:hypothetical protein
MYSSLGPPGCVASSTMQVSQFLRLDLNRFKVVLFLGHSLIAWLLSN